MPPAPAVRDLPPVSRGQNAVYVLPHDWAAISEFLAPLLERVDAESPDVQLAIATPDADAAAAVIAASARLVADKPVRVLAATSAARATRLAKLRAPHVVAGTPAVLLALVKASAIRLADVRGIAIAWADELVTRGESGSLEALMADVPKDAPRTIVSSVVTPAVEELVERYARRARREVGRIPEGREPIAIEYVLISAAARQSALRRLLDELDPASALVFARANDSAAVTAQLRALGYDEHASVQAGLVAPPSTALAVLFDLPASHEELREAVSGAIRRIALIQPRQLESLRSLALGGSLTPHRLPEPIDASLAREAAMLAQLRDVLETGGAPRELLWLEPLLEDFDGAEVAAVALRLLEQERAQHARSPAERAAHPERAQSADRPVSAPPPAPMVRLFASVGDRDGARPGDLVAMITSKAGIEGADIGRIDIRESHSTIEVAASVADQVIERASGTPVKGRRALLKRDERPVRREAGARDRPPRRDDQRGDRPRGDRPSGERGAPRGRDRDAGPRRDSRARDDRPRRETRGRDRDDRPRREPRGPRHSPRA